MIYKVGSSFEDVEFGFSKPDLRCKIIDTAQLSPNAYVALQRNLP
jgi:hypothetical protein